MRITGLDLATRICGWCSGAGDAMPKADTWELPQTGDDLGLMLEHYDMALTSHLERFQPEAVCYEAPILVVKKGEVGRTDKLLTIRKIYSLGGFTEFRCASFGIPCHEVNLRKIKREITGNQLAEKDEMVEVALRVGLALPSGPGRRDATDAWGAWLLGVRAYTPQFSPAWDKAIWSPRGAFL